MGDSDERSGRGGDKLASIGSRHEWSPGEVGEVSMNDPSKGGNRGIAATIALRCNSYQVKTTIRESS
jgi:hypothetical protein